MTFKPHELHDRVKPAKWTTWWIVLAYAGLIFVMCWTAWRILKEQVSEPYQCQDAGGCWDAEQHRCLEGQECPATTPSNP